LALGYSIPEFIRRYWVESAAGIIFSALLAWQLFLPGFIGLANNGDFGKITGWLGLAPTKGWDASYFAYFEPDYTWSERNFASRGFVSSEIPLAGLGQRLANATHEGAHFDIRILGAVHAALYVAAFVVFMGTLRSLRLWARLTIAAVAVFFFTDVNYVAYLNSLYMDVPAICGLLLMVTSAVWICLADTAERSGILLYTFGALLFVTSKTQHAIWAPLFALLLVVTAARFRQASVRWICAVAAVATLGGCAFMIANTDKTYRAAALFNVLFFRLGGRGPVAMGDLREVGVQDDEVRFLGMHAFVPGGPVSDPEWARAFYDRTGYTKLVRWYLMHPVRTLELLDDTLKVRAEQMRQKNLSNYRAEDGRGKGAKTNRFAAWSNLRSALFSRWPHHILIWYAAFTAAAIAVIRKSESQRAVRVAWLGLALVLLAAGEFAVASLADAIETHRHLIIFHECTDLTICLAIAWAARRSGRVRTRPGV
jgi:hypothetical protein